MSLVAQREQVWVSQIEDKPGGLSEKLSALAQAGANLTTTIPKENL